MTTLPAYDKIYEKIHSFPESYKIQHAINHVKRECRIHKWSLSDEEVQSYAAMLLNEMKIVMAFSIAGASPTALVSVVLQYACKMVIDTSNVKGAKAVLMPGYVHFNDNTYLQHVCVYYSFDNMNKESLVLDPMSRLKMESEIKISFAPPLDKQNRATGDQDLKKSETKDLLLMRLYLEHGFEKFLKLIKASLTTAEKRALSELKLI